METPAKPERIRRITKDDLVQLACYKKKEELLEKLNQKFFGFERFLKNREYCVSNDNVDCDIIATLVQIISEACTVSLERYKGSLIKFLRMLKECKQFVFNDVLLAINTLLIEKHPKNLILLTSQYLIIIYTLISYCECPEVIDDVFPAIQNFFNVMKSRKLRNFEEVQMNFDKIKKRIDRYDTCSTNQPSDDLDKIRNFRDLSIVPKENDVTNCEIPDLPHNIIDAPYEDVDHYLGVHFRLTREDMLRSFRECVKNCLECDDIAISRSSNRKYPNVFVKPPPMFNIRGICYKIEVKSNKDMNWTKKEILTPGCLVCLTPNNFHKVIFASVKNLKAKSGLSKECTLEIMLEDDLYEDKLLPNLKYLMIEPHAYFECYKHVLTSIKSFTTNSFPLADYLVHLESNDTSPEYLRDPESLRGKKYCLHERCDAVTEDGSHPCKEFNPLNYEEWPSAKELKLDDQQHKAFQLALTNKVAVIQGPPGTGKTFIGKKVVKAFIDNAPLFPIIICCLTNHALDQFLEGMLEYTQNVVRLGSQSKSRILDSYKIDNLVYTMNQYKDNNYSENYHLKTDATAKHCLKHLRSYMPHLLEAKAGGEYDSDLHELKLLCNEINSYLEMMDLCQFRYLEEDALNAIIGMKEKDQLRSGSNTHGTGLNTSILEWLTSSRKSDLYTECEKRFQKFKREGVSGESKTTKLWSLNLSQRFANFYIWREKCLAILEKNISTAEEEYKVMKLKGVSSKADSIRIDILQSSQIIGVTTTGAAKYRELIRHTNPSILIVEEAAEVLESHIIASLLPTTKHLILIGDHKQLRPLPSDHELSELYNLKISMFERLFNNNAPSSTLVYQHRMKPCIADLLVNDFLYNDLKSYENVYSYKEIRGVKSSVFFLNHTEAELENSSSTSSSNEYEAKMIAALTKYLLVQSYTSDKITVLATYAAQVSLIQKYLDEASIEVKLTTVDNYQGEENDIIILSFVRNNKSGVIGFLRENNRVCVALSRAKMGMFCLGNFTMYAARSPLWSNIVDKLEAQNMIGDKFPLQCSRHGSETYVQTQDEVLEFIERGCQEPCNFQLPCGHTCVKKCHYYDVEHKLYQCKSPCEKYIDDNRKCPRLCFQRCKRVKKNSIMLPCGHESRSTINNPNLLCYEEVPRFLPCKHQVTLPCNTDITEYQCKASETVILSCGHEKKVPCYKKDQLNFIICHEKRPLLSPCGHTVDVECNLDLEGHDLLAYCKKTCNTLLNCQHACLGYCQFCFDFGIHALCTSKCDQKLPCGHPCRGYCNSPCPPCKEMCGLVCPHNDPKESRCINSCYRPCVECHKPCKLSCEHVVCPKRCFEECTVEPCSNICKEILPCGHECIGLCGDPCPYMCRVCNEFDIESGVPKYDRYVMLDDCDHIVEIQELTEHIDECLLNLEWPHCPSCSKPIYQSLRFKNKLLIAKRRLYEICDTAGTISDIQYHLHTAFNEDYLVPAEFSDLHRKIKYILEQEDPSVNVLVVLKPAVVSLRRLVKIHEKLEKCREGSFNEYVRSRFETLLLWLSNHLKYASYQQLLESEEAIDALENLVE